MLWSKSKKFLSYAHLLDVQVEFEIFSKSKTANINHAFNPATYQLWTLQKASKHLQKVLLVAFGRVYESSKVFVTDQAVLRSPGTNRTYLLGWIFFIYGFFTLKRSFKGSQKQFSEVTTKAFGTISAQSKEINLV